MVLGEDTIQRKEIGQRFKDRQWDYDHGLTSSFKRIVKFGPVDKIPSGLLS